jgi:hypothetical protein
MVRSAAEAARLEPWSFNVRYFTSAQPPSAIGRNA